MKLQGAIFDLDGVLLDSMQVWNTIGETYLISEGIIPDVDVTDKIRTMSIVEAALYFSSKYGIQKTTTEIMDGVNNLMKDFYFQTVLPKSGVVEFLEKLKQNGIKMCIATATERFLVEEALKRNHMFHYFDRIFTCPEVKQGKDKPDIYLQALDFLDMPMSDAVIFEDALYAIKTAKTAGFTVAAIYEETANADQIEIKELADFYIDSYKTAVIEFSK